MNTYWEQKGKYQELYERLHKELVPDSGVSDTTAGEIIRTGGNVYYDLYNNGGCNLGDSKAYDLHQFTSYLSLFGFGKLRILKRFLHHFESTEVAYCGYGDKRMENGDGYENFDELFTDEVELALQEAIDLLVLEAEKLYLSQKTVDTDRQ